MEDSVTLDDINVSAIIQGSEAPFVDSNTVCSCRSMCLREKGRNACPCKNIGHFCSEACHEQTSSACLNRRSVADGDASSDTRESSFEEYNPNEGNISQQQQRGPNRNLRRGFRGWANRGRSRRATSSRRGVSRRVEGARRQQAEERARNRGRRSGHSGGLVAEAGLEGRQIQHEEQLQELISGLSEDVLRRLATELLRRQPAVFADLVRGELPIFRDTPDGEPMQPGENQPDWCKCGLCVVMPTQNENKCCTQTVRPCITTHPLFYQIVLDGNILDIAMRYREDILATEHPRSNENFRHAAYRQFVLWQHGRLGQGNRRVVPSCCVKAIRTRYPSPNGIYVGFRPARL